MKGRLTLAVFSGAGALGAGVGLAAVAAWLIAKAAEQPPIDELLLAAVAVRAFGVSKGVLRYAERLLSHDVALRALADLRLGVYRKLTHLAPAGLAAFRRGDLLTRLSDDVTAVQDRYPRVLVPARSAGLAGLVAVLIATALLPVAGLVLLIGVVTSAIAVPRMSVAVASWADRRLAAGRAELSSRIVETLDGVEELTVLGALPSRVHAVRRIAGRLAGTESRLAWLHGTSSALSVLVLGITVAMTLVVATPALRAGSLSAPALAVLALLPLAVFDATTGLASAIRERQRVAAAAERVGDLLAVEAPDPVAPAEPCGHGITVRGLRARWPGADRDALSGIDLDLPPGRRIAVVGPSGSGKSTLLASLLRFCPVSGEITLGGATLGAVPDEILRRTVGLAAADAHVFDSTLAANLRLARPAADDNELLEALDRAGLLDWVLALPRGLETPVGEHGRNLSGGQRQRLALARALLADVPVLLCDEPDASLDPALAARLTADLLAAAGDRSVLLVTHRLEGVTGVDEILVLQDGRVTQRGTHDELVALPGWYRERWHELAAGGPPAQARVTVTGTGLLMMSRTGDVR
ncbi:MAG TPA: thiol reductant ABC exporter subunit CydC [Jiangellaceae bacterium]